MRMLVAVSAVLDRVVLPLGGSRVYSTGGSEYLPNVRPLDASIRRAREVGLDDGVSESDGGDATDSSSGSWV